MIVEAGHYALVLALVLALIMAHEAGHWTAARILGLPASFGYVLRPFPYPVVRMPVAGRRETILVALAGPFVNLVVAWPMWIAGQPLVAIVSALLGLVSLVPIGAQDGTHILNAWRNTK